MKIKLFLDIACGIDCCAYQSWNLIALLIFIARLAVLSEKYDNAGGVCSPKPIRNSDKFVHHELLVNFPNPNYNNFDD